MEEEKRPRPLLCRWGFHKWSVWGEPEVVRGTIYGFPADRLTGAEAVLLEEPINTQRLEQQRTCCRCNVADVRTEIHQGVQVADGPAAAGVAVRPVPLVP